MALRDQLLCGLHEQKMQKELLCVPDLTIAVATERAKAAEAVNRETKQLNPEPVATHQLNKQTGKCHRCGKQGHTGANCIHRNKCCHYCKKVGHLSSVRVQRKQDAKIKEHKNKRKRLTLHTELMQRRQVAVMKKSLMPDITMSIILLVAKTVLRN